MKHFLLTVTFLSATLALGKLPPDYQTLLPEQKRDILWNNIRESQYEELPSADVEALLAALISALVGDAGQPSLRATLQHAEDELPPQKMGKFIHPLGTVVKVKYQAEKADASLGILGENSVHGLLRLSLAAPYIPNASSFIPGIALKLFRGNADRDRLPSVNIMAMQKLEGQGDDTNFFSHNLSTLIPAPEIPRLTGDLDKIFEDIRRHPLNPLARLRKLKQLERKKQAKLFTYLFLKHFQRQFEKATGGHAATELPLKHLVSMNSKGVADAPPAAARSLVFHPTPEARDLFRGAEEEDYRQTMERTKIGTVLYEVYLKASSETPLQKIGKLVTESRFVASSYGDDLLFFQHHFP